MKSLGSRLYAVIVAALLQVVSASDYDFEGLHSCFPSDYMRVAAPCDPATNTRKITFEVQRNCSDPFTLADATDGYTEPCGCTPADYVADYSLNHDTQMCELTFTPKNCVGGKNSDPMQVDELYCEVEKKPCGFHNVLSTYTQCNTDLVPSVEVIFYFDNTCNPNAPGSVHLPPSNYIPCDLHCEGGSVLDGTECSVCPEGAFSMGGGIRLEGFASVDPALFKTSCVFRNDSWQMGNGTKTTALQNCEPWHEVGGKLQAGPYNKANDWFQDECYANPAHGCHNSLTSSLVMQVKLVRPGYVRFNYTVNAEKGYDGLTFTIDQGTHPELGLVSYEFTPKQAIFDLEEGYHTLTWAYVKDEKWTRGSDSAVITMIEVDGTDFNDAGCTPCAPGFYNDLLGQAECKPCAPDTYSDSDGLKACVPCPEGQYTPTTPRISCTTRPTCNVAVDATVGFSKCGATLHNRTKTYAWLQPQICMPTSDTQLPAPLVEACPPCPPGSVAGFNTTDYTRSCHLCPAGQVRSAAMTECQSCPLGEAAVRVLTLAHFEKSDGALPDGFYTGCSGDCGSPGWRALNEDMDSGDRHGSSASVWLGLNVSVEMDGEVRFNYSVDIPLEDSQRGFFFYIDDTLADSVLAGDLGESAIQGTPAVSGPWALARGTHTLMWNYVKVAADPNYAVRDNAIIYDIEIRGEERGGAEGCEPIPPGAQKNLLGMGWVDCPAGSFSTGGEGKCEPCPANTYNPSPMGAAAACLPCGAYTTSLANSTSCVMGDVSNPEAYCSVVMKYAQPLANGEEWVVYDLAPLDRVHPGEMFGPVYENRTKHERENEARYWLNPCAPLKENKTCVDFRGQALDAYICRAWGHTAFDTSLGTHSPAHSLGSTLSLRPIGTEPRLMQRGVVLEFLGEKCASNQGLRQAAVTMVCDPDSGYGQPEAWTSDGLATVLDAEAAYPWVNRTGELQAIEQADHCSYSMVWYSSVACPMCSLADMESVEVQDCKGGVKRSYRYKEPKTCQTSPMDPLPADLSCFPCTVSNYAEEVGACVDNAGVRNVTHRWQSPLNCWTGYENSVQLPPDVVAGPCVQTVVQQAALSILDWFLVALGMAAIVGLSMFGGFIYLKNRELYSAYSKLKGQEKLGDYAMEEGEAVPGGVGAPPTAEDYDGSEPAEVHHIPS